MATDINKEMKLHFIDRASTALTETNQTLNRILIALIVICFIIIALSIGIVSVQPGVTVAGLNVSVPFALILIAGSLLTPFLLIYYMIINNRRKSLINTIYRLYKDISYHDEGFDKYYGSLIDTFNFQTFAFDYRNKDDKLFNLFNNTSIALFAIIGLLTPLTTPIFALYRLIYLYGWTWWLILNIFIVILLTAISAWHLLQNEYIKND